MEHEEGMTVLGMTRADRHVVFAIFGAGGLLLFLASPWLARWLESLPFVPFSRVLEWLGSFDQAWAWVARSVVGLAVGLVFAAVIVSNEYRLEVGDRSVVVARGDDRRKIAREAIVGVYRERKKVVIHGVGGRVLFDEDVDASKDAVRGAFSDRGYPWESL